MDKHTNDTAPQVAPRKSAVPRDLAALAKTPADASLLRAVAADVEAEDSGYVYGAVTAAQLRKLAERLDGGPLKAVTRVLDAIEANPADAHHEIVFVWHDPGAELVHASLSPAERRQAAPGTPSRGRRR
jgi:hypothetical protein